MVPPNPRNYVPEGPGLIACSGGCGKVARHIWRKSVGRPKWPGDLALDPGSALATCDVCLPTEEGWYEVTPRFAE